MPYLPASPLVYLFLNTRQRNCRQGSSSNWSLTKFLKSFLPAGWSRAEMPTTFVLCWFSLRFRREGRGFIAVGMVLIQIKAPGRIKLIKFSARPGNGYVAFLSPVFGRFMHLQPFHLATGRACVWTETWEPLSVGDVPTTGNRGCLPRENVRDLGG